MRRSLTTGLVLLAGACQASFDPSDAPRADGKVTPDVRYRLVRLEPAGPGLSQGAGINNRGWVVGYTGITGGTREAAVWRDGVITRLGTLPGGGFSSVQWPGVNNTGMIVGIARTAEPDSLGESWSCSAFLGGAGKVCRGFVWENDHMTALRTFGGTNGFAAGVNNNGEVVGWAETAVHDSTCNAPQVLQFRAARWNPRKDTMEELPPLPGDSASAATAINERGQVVGISGDCDVSVGRKSARSAVLWDRGRVVEIGNLGGGFWHTPMAINNRGEIVGFGNPPNGNIDGDSLRAFYWSASTGIRNLGRWPGDLNSQALSINGRGDIVGLSCAAACRALLWRDGVMLRLQDLLETETNDTLWSARGIDDTGRITGRIRIANTGVTKPFLAIPVPVAMTGTRP
jgi:probable HAF family extracellular repeat protein